jgi:hypothetical protein
LVVGALVFLAAARIHWFLATLTLPVFIFLVFVVHLMTKPPFSHPHFNQANLCSKQDTLNDASSIGYWCIGDDGDKGFGDPLTDLGITFTSVEIPLISPRSPGNKFLRGWLVAAPGGSKEVCLVCLHGAGRDRRAWLRHLPVLRESAGGCAVLLFDCQVQPGRVRRAPFTARRSPPANPPFGAPPHRSLARATGPSAACAGVPRCPWTCAPRCATLRESSASAR